MQKIGFVKRSEFIKEENIANQKFSIIIIIASSLLCSFFFSSGSDPSWLSGR